MAEEKTKQNNKKCPLCEVSKETIEKLKNKGEENKKNPSSGGQTKKPFWKLW